MSESTQQFIQQAGEAIAAGDFLRAVELADQAIALEPGNSDAHVVKAIALAQSGQPDAATQAFRQAIAANPTNPKAYYNLATHQYQQNQKAEAMAMAEEALRLDPRHTAARDLIALIQSEMRPAAPETPSMPTMGSETMAPPSPYGTPPTAGSPYMRPAYGAPEHNLAFVGNMGGTWTTIGWVLIAIGWVSTIISYAILGANIGEVFRAGATGADPNSAAFAGGSFFLNCLGALLWVGFIVWQIMDIVDKRRNWAWILAGICCFPILPTVYMLVGRK